MREALDFYYKLEIDEAHLEQELNSEDPEIRAVAAARLARLYKINVLVSAQSVQERVAEKTHND